jgi:hypothetical protein
MPSAFCAEWLIARFTDHRRAAAAVGDLLEVAPEQGPLWFWLSVAGIVLSLTWRRLVGFLAGFFTISFLTSFPMPLQGLPTGHEPPENWAPFFTNLIKFGGLVWIATPYAAICYGFRDEFSQLLLTAFVLVTAIIFFWWIPAVAFTAIALGIGILTFSVAAAQRRQALLGVGMALAVGFCGVKIIFYLWPEYLALFQLSATGYWLSVHGSELLVVAIQAAACGWTHRLLLRDRQRGPETESIA